MKLLTVLLTMLISASFAGMKVSYSNYNDSTSFMEKGSASYSVVNNIHELSINGKLYRSPSKQKYSVSMSTDFYYQDEYSPFVFASYSIDSSLPYDYTRIGYGVAWNPARNMNKFPYYWKYSVASIHDYNVFNPIVSFRVKFKANVMKFTVRTTVFMLGYSDTVDLNIGFKLNKNVSLKYMYDYERIGSARSSSGSLGIELKI